MKSLIDSMHFTLRASCCIADSKRHISLRGQSVHTTHQQYCALSDSSALHENAAGQLFATGYPVDTANVNTFLRLSPSPWAAASQSASWCTMVHSAAMYKATQCPSESLQPTHALATKADSNWKSWLKNTEREECLHHRRCFNTCHAVIRAGSICSLQEILAFQCI